VNRKNQVGRYNTKAIARQFHVAQLSQTFPQPMELTATDRALFANALSGSHEGTASAQFAFSMSGSSQILSNSDLSGP